MYGNVNQNARRPDDEDDAGDYGENIEDNIDRVQVVSIRPRVENSLVTQLDRKQMKRQKKLIFQQYYRGTFYSKCTSATAYDLSVQLNKESKEILWWRIIGFTDQVVHQKIDSDL